MSIPALGGRFELRERLGSGAYGEVWRAFDARLERDVALKLLHKHEPAALLRFKREFRAVADVEHPNLVRLHELFHDGERWFFTMELVDGPSLDAYLRPEGALEHERLRPAFAGLVAGLAALHAHGHVHRDVKPSNVRVARDGRPILLDFGLSTELDVGSAEAIVGTPLYMAPEQVEGHAATPATDFYAVGVMLYEALAGRPPFVGKPVEVLVRKRLGDPPALDDAPDGALRPLAALTMELLCRDPEARPDAARLRALLGDASPERPARASRRGAFVGRQAELARLEAALDATRARGGRVVWLEGPPGSGKSALLRRFAERVGDDARVLGARCYEGEAVPYVGVDALVDRLAQWLRSATPEVARSCVPSGAAALAELFPVLGQIRGFEARGAATSERTQLRADAIAALRDLLGRVARAPHALGRVVPLVVTLDDLQWADADACAILAGILAPPDPVPMLFVGSFRADAPSRSPWLATLAASIPAETIALAPLPTHDATALASSLLDERDTERAARIADAAAGNPLLVELLARFGRGDTVDLRGAVARSLGELSPASRHLLELVCLAGQPLDRRAALRALATGADAGEERASAELRSRGLLLVAPGPSPESLEPYHDRIREAVVADLGPERRAELHRRLADALVSTGGDPEVIALHLEGAGRSSEAARWTVEAAARAERTLAWERAATLYTRALALESSEGPELPSRAALEVALGDALGNLGRGPDAVEAYRRALSRTRHGPRRHGAPDEVELLRRIAEQLLRSGRMDEGIEALDQALRHVDMRFPRRAELALGTLLAARARLRLRGLRFRRRDAAEVDPRLLRRVDLGWSAGVGLASVDSVRGAAFQARSLLDALDAGEPHRVARALAYEAAYQANGGLETQPRARALLREIGQLADELGDPYLHALSRGAACIVEFHGHAFRRATTLADESEGLFRESRVGMVKEIATVQLLGMASLLFLGELEAMRRRLPALIRAAESRADLFTLASFRSGFVGTGAFLAADDVAKARAEAQAAATSLSSREYVIQSFFDLWGRVQIELYEGDGTAALARVQAGWSSFRRSLLTRLPFLRITGHELAARAALAASARDRRALALARKHLRDVAAEAGAFPRALASALEAGLAYREGDHGAAEARLAEAAARFDTCDMAAHAACARAVRGRLLGGERGASTSEAAEAKLRELGVVAPARWIRSWLPWAPEPR